jgi:hypothetical protein
VLMFSLSETGTRQIRDPFHAGAGVSVVRWKGHVCRARFAGRCDRWKRSVRVDRRIELRAAYVKHRRIFRLSHACRHSMRTRLYTRTRMGCESFHKKLCMSLYTK